MTNRELHLEPRLQCLADCVPSGARLADIGTDHGYLPVWLLRSGRIPFAIASDINAAPLEHARRTARKYCVEDRMEFRLCAGLDAVKTGESDTVVVAGMGGENILSILGAAPRIRDSDALFLLQPMTKAELLRQWLAENGFCTESERLVRDKGTIYPVLAVRVGLSAPLSPAEAWCGTRLLRDPLYGAYAGDRIRKLERAAEGLRHAVEVDEARLAGLEADAAALREKVKEWENANSSGN